MLILERERANKHIGNKQTLTKNIITKQKTNKQQMNGRADRLAGGHADLKQDVHGHSIREHETDKRERQ